MRIFIRDTTGVYRHKIERELGKDATGQQVLDYLLGPYGAASGGSHWCISRSRSGSKTTPRGRSLSVEHS